MTVYVDNMYESEIGRFGRMKMSHLIADTDAELHAMADAIGVDRKWWQAPPSKTSHYDIAMSKRKQAIDFGAITITYRQFAGMATRRDVTGQLGSPDDAEQWHRAFVGMPLEERARLRRQGRLNMASPQTESQDPNTLRSEPLSVPSPAQASLF